MFRSSDFPLKEEVYISLFKCILALFAAKLPAGTANGMRHYRIKESLKS